MNQDRILLFIPMYNCEKQIVRVLGQIDEQVLAYITEIIIVNNRSTDNSEAAAVNYCKEHRNLPVKILRNHENYGLGGSHKVAFQYALNHGFDYVIVLHGDDQGSVRDLLPALKKGSYRKFDCCLGARFTGQSKLIGYSWIRIVGNIVFNIIFSIVLGRRVFDLGAGLNMYSVEMLRNQYYHTYPDNLTFNVYMLMATKAYHQKYAFFPLTWRETDQVSNAKVMRQAVWTMKMAISYFFKGKEFLEADSRNVKYTSYTYQEIGRG